MCEGSSSAPSLQIRAALFTFCFEVLQFFSKQTDPVCADGGVSLIPLCCFQVLPLGHFWLGNWSSNLLGVALEEVAWGCPVPVPAGTAPAAPLARAVGRARLPHAAQPSLPESPRAGRASAAWEKQLETPRAELCPKAAPSAWADGVRTTPKFSRAPPGTCCAPREFLGVHKPKCGTHRGEGAHAGCV